MICERAMICFLSTPHSIYFRMVMYITDGKLALGQGSHREVLELLGGDLQIAAGPQPIGPQGRRLGSELHFGAE